MQIAQTLAGFTAGEADILRNNGEKSELTNKEIYKWSD